MIKTILKVFAIITINFIAIESIVFINSYRIYKKKFKNDNINDFLSLMSPYYMEFCKGFYYKNKIIYISDKLVYKAGCKLSMATTDGNIFVDNDFFNLSENAKTFILEHELGHLKDFNNNKYKPSKLNNLFRIIVALFGVQKSEQSADKNSVEIIGKENAVKALEEIKNIFSNSFINKHEIKNRIKLIER